MIIKNGNDFDEFGLSHIRESAFLKELIVRVSKTYTNIAIGLDLGNKTKPNDFYIVLWDLETKEVVSRLDYDLEHVVNKAFETGGILNCGWRIPHRIFPRKLKKLRSGITAGIIFYNANSLKFSFHKKECYEGDHPFKEELDLSTGKFSKHKFIKRNGSPDVSLACTWADWYTLKNKGLIVVDDIDKLIKTFVKDLCLNL